MINIIIVTYFIVKHLLDSFFQEIFLENHDINNAEPLLMGTSNGRHLYSRTSIIRTSIIRTIRLSGLFSLVPISHEY